MRYRKATIIKNVDNGVKDDLGNPIFSEESFDVDVRLTNWTADDIEIFGRGITTGGRKVLLKPIRAVISNEDRINIDEEVYHINTVREYDRWTMLIVTGYKL